jgi:hypothetical protein
LGRDRDKAGYRSYLEGKERSKVQIKREARYSGAGIETKQGTDHILEEKERNKVQIIREERYSWIRWRQKQGRESYL